MDVVEFNAGNFFFPRFPDMELPIKGFGSPPDITKCTATLLFSRWKKKTNTEKSVKFGCFKQVISAIRNCETKVMEKFCFMCSMVILILQENKKDV